MYFYLRVTTVSPMKRGLKAAIRHERNLRQPYVTTVSPMKRGLKVPVDRHKLNVG